MHRRRARQHRPRPTARHNRLRHLGRQTLLSREPSRVRLHHTRELGSSNPAPIHCVREVQRAAEGLQMSLTRGPKLQAPHDNHARRSDRSRHDPRRRSSRGCPILHTLPVSRELLRPAPHHPLRSPPQAVPARIVTDLLDQSRHRVVRVQLKLSFPGEDEPLLEALSDPVEQRDSVDSVQSSDPLGRTPRVQDVVDRQIGARPSVVTVAPSPASTAAT